jgi:hypothetical protein
MAKRENYVLTWQEDDRPVIGEGLSRTANMTDPLWLVDVEFGAGPRMKSTVRAANKRDALKYAKNRHPKASSINVIGRAR